MKTLTHLAAAAISVFGILSASAAESRVLNEAGFPLPATELSSPAPRTLSDAASKTPGRPNQWLTLRKITINEAQPDQNDTLIGMVAPGQNIGTVAKELREGGFKTEDLQGNSIIVDVKGQDAADRAVGLARYYYITEVKVSQQVYTRIFGPRTKSTFAVKMGTISGTMNRSLVDLKINKLDWTITGAVNYSPINVKINHDDKTITGGANYSPVSLAFAWSTEEVTVEGGANHSPVKYTVNWKNGLLEGYANHAPLKLEFTMDEGNADADIVTVTGYTNRAPVLLTYNKITGHIGGYMNRSAVDAKLVNCDLYDFLQYFFLFIRKEPF